MIKADYIVVGSGLSGATIARLLADAGREVVVLERRPRLGGNVADAKHEESGILYGLHGPHFFRTSSDRVWDFANRFADFWHYAHRVMTFIDGELIPWPIQRADIERIAGIGWRPAFMGRPKNFEKAALSMMPRIIYEKAVKPYNEKQWGKQAYELSASLCKRFDIRHGDTRLTPNAKYQGMPLGGYSLWMQQMLAGIPLHMGFDYLACREDVEARRNLIFTGPIDEYFGFRLGKLAYRAQRRVNTYTRSVFSLDKLTPAQVNYPRHESGAHIRRIEWRRLMPRTADVLGSLITEETPYSPDNPDCYEYPVPDSHNEAMYEQYRELANAEERVTFCGRLGSYRYLDMDQAIGAAMKIVEKLLKD